MRVVQVSTWDTACGIAHYTRFLHDGLAERGVDVEVVTVDRDEARYLPRRELREHFAALAARVPAADVVHIQHEFAFFRGRYGYATSVREFARFLRAVSAGGRRVVVTFHTDPLNFLRTGNRPLDVAAYTGWAAVWRASIPPLINRRANITAIVHTRMARAGLIDSGVRPERVALIPHGIPDFGAPSPEQREESRRRLGVGEQDTVLGIFGFLARYKGHMTAVRALRRLPESFHLLLVGGPHPESSDPTLEDVLSYLDEYPELASRVTITGYQDDAAAQGWLAACDVMLGPYLPGTTVMASGALGRSLGSGRPVIVSAIDSFVELSRQAHCVELVTPGSPHELARAALLLARDPARQEALVEAAARYVAINRWPRMAEFHEELYVGRVPDIEPRLAAPPSAPAAAGAPVLYAAERPAEEPQEPEEAVTDLELRSAEVAGAGEITFVLEPDRFDDPLVEQLKREGLVDDPPNVLARHLLGPGDRFLDVGAHVGTFSLPAAAAGAEVIAVDASATSVRLLRAAAALNGVEDRCRVVHAVAAARSGGLERFAEDGVYGSVAFDGSSASDGEDVPTVAVDQLLAEHGWDGADVVKVDVEGFELQALAGMSRLLGESSPTLIVECNAKCLGRFGATTRDLMEHLESLGFALHAITRTEPHRLAPVGSADVQTEAIVDLVAFKSEPAGLAPWYVSAPYGEAETAARLRTAATQPAAEYRKYAALAIRAAGPEVRDHPDNAATLEALKWDPAEIVRDAALGRTAPGSFGVPLLTEPRAC